MSASVTFEEYLGSLSKLSPDADPTIETAHSIEIKKAAAALAALSDISSETVSDWVATNPTSAYVLGLSLGMSQERLKNITRQLYGTSSVTQRARIDPSGLVSRLDAEFGLIDLLQKQIVADYTFGDVLVARAGGRVRAATASAAGRSVEDEIEQIAKGLGLPCESRTRFVGKHGQTAPCDLAIPSGSSAAIAVAAKGFDSTGSKLTDAVREIQEMAEVRLPKQFICAVIDGMGWLSRQADLRRIYALWETDAIDGLYTLSSLPRFRDDVAEQARLRGYLIP